MPWRSARSSCSAARRPDLPRPYRTWGYPVVPLLFLLASVGMVVNALITEPRDTGITFAIILAGVPAYYAWRALSARRLDGKTKNLAADKRR